MSSSKDDSTHHEEGQLRYWTPDLCSRSLNLFDFVITVRHFVASVLHLTLNVGQRST
jgi:hypothetical protein